MKMPLALPIACLLGSLSEAQAAANPTRSSTELIPRCVPSVLDTATGNCLEASSVPEMGKLYPLGPAFNINSNRVAAGLQLWAYEGVLAFGRTQTLGEVWLGDYLPGQIAADLHVSKLGDATILLAADQANQNEFDQPSLTFSQDGGQVTSRIGFFGGSNDFSVSNLFDANMEFNLPGGSADWEFWKLAGLAVDRKAYINNVGNMAIDGVYLSGGADVAEYYPVEGPVEPGDVVAFTGEGLALARAVSGAGGRLAGIVSTDPGFALGLTYTDEEETGENPEDLCAGDKLAAIRHEIQVNRRAPLALTGRVPCKVTASNGPIRQGDLLTVSPLPGHAMRAKQAGAVLGTALEDWTSGEGTILVLANLGYYSPTEDLERRVAELEAQVRALLKTR